jgi:hypothetical protein
VRLKFSKPQPRQVAGALSSEGETSVDKMGDFAVSATGHGMRMGRDNRRGKVALQTRALDLRQHRLGKFERTISWCISVDEWLGKVERGVFQGRRGNAFVRVYPIREIQPCIATWTSPI